MIVSPTDAQLYRKLGIFITLVVPAGTQVLKALPNRAPIPAGANFVVMQIIHQRRLSTNVHGYADPFPVAGTIDTSASWEIMMQIDCYGPLARDNATMIAQMLRDPYGCESLGPECQPLYADDAKMAPLVTGEEQYLQRWIISALLQYDPSVSLPQQFADTLEITLKDVDVEFPP